MLSHAIGQFERQVAKVVPPGAAAILPKLDIYDHWPFDPQKADVRGSLRQPELTAMGVSASPAPEIDNLLRCSKWSRHIEDCSVN